MSMSCSGCVCPSQTANQSSRRKSWASRRSSSTRLNEKAIQEQLPTRIKGEKGISKLERWLQQENYPSAERDIAFLRRIQRLRSKLTAHRKGSDYETVLVEENVQSDPLQEVTAMLQDAERLLYSFASHVAIDLDS